MKFQFLVEIDLKTLCHGRDENGDAEVLNDREAASHIKESLQSAVEIYSEEFARLTSIMNYQNIERVVVAVAPNEEN